MGFGIKFVCLAAAMAGPLAVIAVAPQAFAIVEDSASLVCPVGTHAEAVAATTPTPPPAVPTPTPAPLPTPPVPPEALKDPGPEDPKQLDIPLLDHALRGEASIHLLPFWHGYPWRKIERPLTWTRHLHDLLATDAQEMVEIEPRDADLFCPNYKNLALEEKRLVWLRLISVIASMESSLRPLAVFHSQRVQRGLYSAGLMMLSLPSAKQKRFGCTMINGYDDIYDWRKNLACSVRIMKHYYLEDRSIAGHRALTSADGKGRWMGLGRYWEPFRDSRQKSTDGRAHLLSKVKQKRKSWIETADSSKHPAHHERAYTAAGELEIERIIRLINTMPLCLSGAPDEFEAASPTAFIPLPRPRPKNIGEIVAPPHPKPKPQVRCVPDQKLE